MWSDISTYKTHRAGVGLMGSEVFSLNSHSARQRSPREAILLRIQVRIKSLYLAVGNGLGRAPKFQLNQFRNLFKCPQLREVNN